MKRSLFGMAITATGVLILLAAPAANARDRVDWSINIGGPVSGYSVYEQPVYVSPPPTYYQPRPVYVQPAPVYYPSYSAYAVPVQPYGSVQFTNQAQPRYWENGRHGGRNHGYRHEYRGHYDHNGHNRYGR